MISAGRVVFVKTLVLGALVLAATALSSAMFLLALVAHARLCVKPSLAIPAAIFVSGVPPPLHRSPGSTYLCRHGKQS